LSRALSHLGKVGGAWVGTPQRMGMKISPKKIELHYNVPLRDHSGALIFIYNKKTDSLEIEARFLGGNEKDRWGIAKEKAEILSLVGFLPLSKPIQMNGNEIHIVWKVSDQQSAASILEFYKLLAEMSLAHAVGNYYSPLEEFITSQLRSSSFAVLLSVLTWQRTITGFWGMLDSAIEREKNYQQVINTAKDLIQTDPESAVRLFEILVEKDQGYSEAIDAAKELMQIDSRIARFLLMRLVGKGQGYQEAIEAAIHLIQTDPRGVVWLFEMLFEKGQGYQEAIEAAIHLIQTDPFEAYILFERLVEKGQGYPEAIEAAAKEAAKHVSQVDPSSALGSAIWLFEKLIEKGQGYEEAIEVAKQLIQTDPENATRLFEKLIEKGQFYQEAIEAAKQLVQTKPWRAAVLFEQLVEKGQGYEEAIEAAKQLDHENASILLKTIVQKADGVNLKFARQAQEILDTL
ncbi:MAG: hypothetical protein K940chlam6_01494, partial [Chlamydiae bacterium]|nr:hypothetical protein [Chlamydiota bacterium]